jgi:hypothetical protein
VNSILEFTSLLISFLGELILIWFMYTVKATEGEHEIEETTRESEGTSRKSGGEGMLMLVPIT